MRPGDRLVCVFVQPLQVGATFTPWPRHITVVPWFRLQVDSLQLAADLAEILQSVSAFTVQMGEERVKFGYRQGKLATLVQLPSPLLAIEQQIRDYLHGQKAWLVDESTKRRHEFRPHVTVQGRNELRQSSSFGCGCLQIFEQRGEHKLIAAEVRLA